MSTAHIPLPGRRAQPTSSKPHALTLAAYLVNLTYIVWFWVMFAAGYWVASWFGIDPVEASITDQGALGWLAVIGLGLVAALPSFIGVALAVRAKRVGAGAAATVALVLNILIPIAWVAVQVLNA